MPNPQRDRIADYVEWTEHRYDPGHYLGGNLPPYLRKTWLGPRARRRAGVFVAMLALPTLSPFAPFLSSGSVGNALGLSGLMLLTIAAAVKIYRSR